MTIEATARTLSCTATAWPTMATSTSCSVFLARRTGTEGGRTAQWPSRTWQQSWACRCSTTPMPLLQQASEISSTAGHPSNSDRSDCPGSRLLITPRSGPSPHDRIRHSLFVVYGGFNDFISDGLTTAAADHAVANLIAIVADLQKRGARWILVPGLLDMGMTPNYTSQGPEMAALATSVSKYFNQKLLASLPEQVLYFDTLGLYQEMQAHPAAFGLTDVVDQCYDPSSNTACANPNQYLFWDFVHPTEHVQIILAARFAFAAFGFDQVAVRPQAEP